MHWLCYHVHISIRTCANSNLFFRLMTIVRKVHSLSYYSHWYRCTLHSVTQINYRHSCYSYKENEWEKSFVLVHFVLRAKQAERTSYWSSTTIFKMYIFTSFYSTSFHFFHSCPQIVFGSKMFHCSSVPKYLFCSVIQVTKSL